jgi:hypothetical protein
MKSEATKNGPALLNLIPVEKEGIMRNRINRAGITFLFITLVLGALVGCNLSSASDSITTKTIANVSAQYIAFYSSTKAYVSAANLSGPASAQGVYTFNPTNPNAGLTGPITGTNGSTMYLQGIVAGQDGMIYVASNSLLGGIDQVLQINPANDSLTGKTFSTTSAVGTTALAWGSYGGSNGVFVGNITYSSSNYLPNGGEIDFINPSGAGSDTPVLKYSTNTAAAAYSIVYLSTTSSLVTTDTVNAYFISLSSPGAAYTLQSGGNAIAASTSNIYVASAAYGGPSTFYTFNLSGGNPGNWTSGTGQDLANFAFYQTTNLLYMADNITGQVWTYNGTSESSTPIVSTNQNATGPVYFHNGYGYIAVGSYNNAAPGVYWFNPTASAPVAVQVGSH